MEMRSRPKEPHPLFSKYIAYFGGREKTAHRMDNAESIIPEGRMAQTIRAAALLCPKVAFFFAINGGVSRTAPQP